MTFRTYRICLFIAICLSGNIPLSSQKILTIDDALSTALKNNFSILIAKNQASISKTNNTWGNAGFLPNLNLGIGQNFTANNTNLEFFSGDTRVGTNKIDNLNANLILGWTLFDGKQMFVNRARLKEMEKIGLTNIQLQVENTTFQVYNTYYNLEQQIKRINVIEDAIKFSKERIDLARLRKDLGAGTELNVLQAEVDMNADSAILINQQLVIKNLKVTLNELMGTPADEDFEPSTTNQHTPIDIQITKDKAITKNIQLFLADQNIGLTQLNLKQWKANKFPRINLNSSYNFSRQEAEIGITKFSRNSGLAIGLSASWNIFNGFNNKREIQVAKLNIENQILSKEQLKNTIMADIQTTINEYQTAQEINIQEEKNLRVAQRNLDITAERLKAGAITNIEMRQAQLNVINVQFRKLSAEFNAKMADLMLRRLSGEL